MITGQIKSQIDRIWDASRTGGITDSITLLGQTTYLLFMKMLDDARIRQESKASASGIQVKVVEGISALDTNNRDAMGGAVRKRTDKSFFVLQSPVIEKGYDLAFNTCKETIREKAEYKATESIMNSLHTSEEAFLRGMVELQKMLAK